VSVNSLSLAGQNSGGGLRLTPNAVAVPAFASHVRPALVLHEREARVLLETASRHDVSNGGCFSAGPAGIQVWSGPWDGPNGGRGESIHLGSVDWSYDTPVRHYATVYRTMVTEAGVNCGETTTSVLARVLALSGLPLEGSRVTMAQSPRRDPFRGHKLP
jgi:hypothetical protein